MAKKRSTPLSEEAISALRASAYAGPGFTLQDSNHGCYPEIKALTETLGGRWDRASGTHRFADGVDAAALVLGACDRGEIPASNPLDYFPTPGEVLDRIFSESWFQERLDALLTCNELAGRPLRALEPSAGTGAIAARLAALDGGQVELTCIEANPMNAAVLRTRCPAATVIEGDFLAVDDPGSFCLAVMNPPFAGRTYQKHLRRAFELLKPMGILAAVAPASFKEMECDAEFLCWVQTYGESYEIPGEPFAGVKTPMRVIFMQKDQRATWRDEPTEGFSTHHAWNLMVSISSDQEMLEKLKRTEDFGAGVRSLEHYVWTLNSREDGALRVEEAIAREAFAALFNDFDLPGPAWAKDFEAKPAAPEPAPAAAPAAAAVNEEGRLALAI